MLVYSKLITKDHFCIFFMSIDYFGFQSIYAMNIFARLQADYFFFISVDVFLFCQCGNGLVWQSPPAPTVPCVDLPASSIVCICSLDVANLVPTRAASS